MKAKLIHSLLHVVGMDVFTEVFFFLKYNEGCIVKRFYHIIYV